jgi:hypothetical protein
MPQFEGGPLRRAFPPAYPRAAGYQEALRVAVRRAGLPGGVAGYSYTVRVNFCLPVPAALLAVITTG